MSAASEIVAPLTVEQQLARAEAALLMLAEPTPEMLEAFQQGFVRQLKRRKNYKPGWEISAEQAGIKALLEVVVKASAFQPMTSGGDQ